MEVAPLEDKQLALELLAKVLRIDSPSLDGRGLGGVKVHQADIMAASPHPSPPPPGGRKRF